MPYDTYMKIYNVQDNTTGTSNTMKKWNHMQLYEITIADMQESYF